MPHGSVLPAMNSRADLSAISHDVSSCTMSLSPDTTSGRNWPRLSRFVDGKSARVNCGLSFWNSGSSKMSTGLPLTAGSQVAPCLVVLPPSVQPKSSEYDCVISLATSRASSVRLVTSLPVRSSSMWYATVIAVFVTGA